MLRTLSRHTGTREHRAAGALRVKGSLLFVWLVVTMTLGKQYTKDTMDFFPKNYYWRHTKIGAACSAVTNKT